MAAVVDSPIPPVLATEKKQSFDLAWVEAIQVFQKAAGIDLKTETPPTADAIRVSFDSKRSKDAEKHAKRKKILDGLDKTLICVSRVGGIAASGASMVFGSPATIAGSALTFLIDAGLQYKKMFAELESLLSRIVEVFERLQIYRETPVDLPPRMVRIAHKVLITVVDICGVCYSVLKSNKPSILGKVVFLGDSGVAQAQLDKLQHIESEEMKTQNTYNLVLAAETKKNVSTGFEKTFEGLQDITNSVQGVQAEFKDRKDLKELKQSLSIKEANYRDQYLRHYYQLSEESGGDFCGWLKEDNAYQAWADHNNSEHTILVLSGEQGFGKTCTVTAIISDLTERHPQLQQNISRASIAYSYMSQLRKGDSKNGMKAEGSPTLPDIIRSLAWQVAQNDLFYLRDLTSVCKRMPNLATTHETWKHLFLDCIQGDATFYLIIDGMHELEAKEQDLFSQIVKSLIAQPHTSFRIKLLLASQSDFIESLNSKLPIKLSEIRLADRTKSDIENHIRREADKMSIFQKQIESVKELKNSVCKGLAEAIGGSFTDADFLLREISGKNDPQEVMNIIERAKQGDGVSNSIADMIKRCNQNLGVKELHDLSTLLLWVIHSEWPLSLEACDSIISLQPGGSSLKPLENQIKDDFSGFLKLDSIHDVYLKHENIAKYFKSLADDQDLASSGSTQTVSKNEIKMVRNFILKFCEDDVYERMGLATFFDQKLSESDTKIAVDCRNAHAIIGVDCLRVLTGDCTHDADNLRGYAALIFAQQLKELDLDDIDPHIKGKIGPHLLNLLFDPKSIYESRKCYGCQYMSYDDDLPKHILRLLRSSAVMKKVKSSQSEAKDWVVTLLDSTQPEIDLWAPMAKNVIKSWLTDDRVDNEANSAFVWIFGYWNLSIQRANGPPKDENMNASLIQEIFKWAQTQTTIDVKAPNTLLNLGSTYEIYGELDEAIECFEAAITVKNDFLSCFIALSDAYAERSEKNKSDEWAKAIVCAERVIGACEDGRDVLKEGDAASYLEKIQLKTAKWNCNLKNYDAADKIYNKLLKKDPQAYQIVQARISMMCAQERWTDVVSSFRDLAEQPHKFSEKESTDLSVTQCDMLLGGQNLFDETDRAEIINAFKKAGKLVEVKQHYRKATKRFEQPLEKHSIDFSRHHSTIVVSLATLLYRHAVDITESDEAIQLWESIIAMDRQGLSLFLPKYLSRQYLPVAYLARATRGWADEMNHDQVVSKIEKLGESGRGDFEIGLSRDVVRSMIGRYFVALDDSKRAREWLKPNIEVGVKLLSDDDPTNDYQGFSRLGEALMDFGDLENAVASFTMIGPEQELGDHESGTNEEPNGASNLIEEDNPLNGVKDADAATTTNSSNGAVQDQDNEANTNDTSPDAHTWQVKRELNGPMFYYCRGDCGKRWTYPDDMYVCRECIDFIVDEGCLAKLQTGELEIGCCGSTHRFVYLPPWDPARQARKEAGCVLVGDQEIPLDDWLAGIRKEWEIEEDSASKDSGSE